MIKHEAQGPPCCVNKNSRLCAVWLQLNDTSVFKSGIDSTLRIERNIFRVPTFSEGESLYGSELIVLGIWPNQSRWRRRIPGNRINWNWSYKEVNDAGKNHDENDNQDSFHEVRRTLSVEDTEALGIEHDKLKFVGPDYRSPRDSSTWLSSSTTSFRVPGWSIGSIKRNDSSRMRR